MLLRDLELCKTGAEAKRLIKEGAIKINDEKVSEEDYVVDGLDDFKLSIGKKKHVRIRFS